MIWLVAALAFAVGVVVGTAVGLFAFHPAQPRDASGTLEQDSSGPEPLLLEPSMLAQEIRRHIAEHKRYERPFSVVHIELDANDAAEIRAVSDRLRASVRYVDQIGLASRRVVLILPHTPREGCRVAAERLAVQAEHAIPRERFILSQATYPDDEQEIQNLIGVLEKQAASVAGDAHRDMRKRLVGR
jgi:hypothetical protein